MEPQDLYGLPLEEFTERRNALARELRRAGNRADAEAVAKLRKPTVAAWAVNQLVRTQQREIAALFEAGDALQKAQADVVARRGDAASLRRTTEAERSAVQQLIETARGLLNADGQELTPARLEQVSETLHAAALDPGARAKLSDGCLEHELRHVGLGGFAALSTESPKRQRSKPEDRDDASQRLKAARQAANAAGRRLEAAERQLRAAEERKQRAAAELADAEQALHAARDLAKQAQRADRQAKKRLEEAKP